MNEIRNQLSNYAPVDLTFREVKKKASPATQERYYREKIPGLNSENPGLPSTSHDISKHSFISIGKNTYLMN